MARDIQSTCQDLLVDTDGVLIVEGRVSLVGGRGGHSERGKRNDGHRKMREMPKTTTTVAMN